MIPLFRGSLFRSPLYSDTFNYRTFACNQLYGEMSGRTDDLLLRQANCNALIAARISPAEETASDVRAVLSGTENFRTPLTDSKLAMAANALT